ncbi:TraB/GumN family protein [Vulcaniibacterium tengchongense]|uniref:TraB family protein n=1 Tax=Vulcaniibacterium tengchongense TaxID=1273429 RepID=A0A3N4VEF3_9GAMM|nr:TraB/GumN family protein [Vulcaniibacterium tengchongense]RPE81366.1 hypothetical protein EDC50_0554 [Vulcaniibacterium tengchongense]
MLRLKTLCALLLALAGLGSVALAVEQGAAAPPGAPAASPPKPLLWKVSDADNAIYLLGSFHLLKPEDYPLSPDIDAAFTEASKVVFEVPPEQMLDPATGQKFLAAAGYADGRSLSQVLPADLREKFARILAQRGATLAQFDGYEPWFVNLSLLIGVSQQMGFRAEQGLDQFLMQQALAAKKPTAGLETIDDQLRVLDASPMEEQIAGLREFLDKPLEMPGKLAELHGAWREGDVARLDALSREEMRGKTPQTYRLVNVERNDAWLPQLQRMLDGVAGEQALVVVGALHLLGEDGLVEKLRGKGYAVERICSACAPAANDAQFAR